ncbi:hypothetical protein HID58_077644 [Brassica napus]|uniref:Uncharacterized protein n=1 Tax=Brassica napus TaxID=3708 RepID=A0ABQ7YR87_BRANA|nr:hypothetical protein HID58_077644 [Brassica napus]
MERSMPESGGPLARRQRQGRPSVTTAEQHDSVGGIGLKGATAALHAEKNVLLHIPTSSTGNIGGGGCWSSCCAVTMGCHVMPLHTSLLPRNQIASRLVWSIFFFRMVRVNLEIQKKRNT